MAALSMLVLLPAVVSPWDPDAYGRPKALLLYAMTGMMAIGWLVSYAGIRAPRWVVTDPEVPLWVFVLMALLSTWTTVDARASFLGVFGRSEGLLVVLAYGALFLVGIHFFGSREGLTTLVRVLGAGSLVVIAYGFTRLWLPPLFPGEARLQDFYGAIGPRVFSLVGGPIVYGGYLSLVAPSVIGLYLTERKVPLVVVWGTGGLLALAAGLLTLSRAGWLGLLAGGAIFLIALGRAGLWAHRRRLLVMAACLAIAFAGLLGTIARPQRVLARAETALEVASGSTAQRLYIWTQTLGLIRQRPLLGWGLETLGRVFPYRRDELVPLFGLRPPIIDRAHNDILHVAVSIGVPGALAYVAFWTLVVIAGVRLVARTDGTARALAAGWLGGLVGYLAHAQFSFSSVAVTPLVWLLAGAACGWSKTLSNIEGSHTASEPRRGESSWEANSGSR